MDSQMLISEHVKELTKIDELDVDDEIKEILRRDEMDAFYRKLNH